MRSMWKPYLIHGGINTIAIVHGLSYGWLTILPRLPASEWRGFIVWLAFSSVGAAAGVLVGLRAILAPIAKVLEAKDRGEPPEAGMLAVAQRRVLNLPLHQLWLSLVIWAASIVGVIPLALAQDLAFTTALHILLVPLMAGVVASVSIHAAIEWYSRERLIPLVVPDGRLSSIRGAVPIPLTARIVALLLTTCTLPITALVLDSIAGFATPALMIYLGATFLVFGGIQALLIAHNIREPMARLTTAMEAVRQGDLSAKVAVAGVDEVGRLSEGFNGMVAGLRRGEFVKETFGRYVTRQVLDEILGGKIALGGELRLATVLFSDIRGFTSLSEKMPAEEVVRFLNRYLDRMVDAVVDHQGTIDKFIGDAVMASFGVPLARADDAERAVRSALAMLERLAELNVERSARGEAPIDIGIGLHTGEVIAGNIGSAKKMEYTIIGDTVNTASRIEQLNKQLGTRLLISSDTYDRVAAIVNARELAPILVKGKEKPLRIFEVTGLRAEP